MIYGLFREMNSIFRKNFKISKTQPLHFQKYRVFLKNLEIFLKSLAVSLKNLETFRIFLREQNLLVNLSKYNAKIINHKMYHHGNLGNQRNQSKSP